MNGDYAVLYSPRAKDDLSEIYSYIASDLESPGNAKGQTNRIREEIRSLGFMPARYDIVDWELWRSMGMHKVPVDNFVIFYTIDDERRTVTVIRIFYGGRDISEIINSGKA